MATQANNDSVNQHIRDITECSICTETFSDPRMLPCIHTFCLKCLEGLGKSKSPGDHVSCPMCRKKCIIPSDGASGFPKNFFMRKLLEIKLPTAATPANAMCVVCSEAKTATKYCVDCQENMCDGCADFHVKNKPCRLHKVVKIGEAHHAELVKMRSTYCAKHPNESLKMYCFECKVTVCVLCCLKNHQTHKCTDIDEVSEEFRNRLTADVKELAELANQTKVRRSKIQRGKSTSLKEINQVRESILMRGTAIKVVVDSHMHSLLENLNSMKGDNLEEVRLAIEDQDQQLVMLESLKKFCEELQENGTPCDITRIADDLHDRTKEMQDMHSSQTRFSSKRITFVSTNLEESLKSLTKSNKGNNMVGMIQMTRRKTEKSILSNDGQTSQELLATSSGSEVTVVKKAAASRITGYSVFKRMCREEQDKNNSGVPLNFSEFSKECSDNWKAMNGEQQFKYEKMAEKEEEMGQPKKRKVPENYEGGGGGKRKKEEANTSTEAKNAWPPFVCQEERLFKFIRIAEKNKTKCKEASASVSRVE